LTLSPSLSLSLFAEISERIEGDSALLEFENAGDMLAPSNARAILPDASDVSRKRGEAERARIPPRLQGCNVASSIIR